MQVPHQPDRPQSQPRIDSRRQRETVEEYEPETVTRSVDIDAGVEDVWEALATDEGRQAWIEPDPNRVLIVDSQEPGERISWWWWSAGQPATHVALRVVAIPTGARVIITETGPSSFPVAELAASFHRTLAFA
jgi:uncharacterized protein YndB with AHSA1/START domain